MHYYMLLYKLKSSHIIWIVKQDLHYYDLIDRISKLSELENYTSNIDEYYIIKQNNCSEQTLSEIYELKQFTEFRLDKNSELIFKSK